MAIGAFGAVIGGLIADHISIQSTFVFSGITIVTSALALIIIPTRSPQVTTPPLTTTKPLPYLPLIPSPRKLPFRENRQSPPLNETFA